MLKINEIFHSIQGESSYVGYPTTFVRTSGCHLRCSYCDTTYAYHQGQMMTLDAIMTAIRAFPAQYVCITGGEPLLQNEVHRLMRSLCDMGYRVSLETSGDRTCVDVDPRVLKVVDIKTPDSGEPDRFCTENLCLDPTTTEFKFVICSERDFEWAEDFANRHQLFLKYKVLYSPSFRVMNEQWLAEKILKCGSHARLQLQLHKYIWTPETRGV